MAVVAIDGLSSLGDVAGVLVAEPTAGISIRSLPDIGADRRALFRIG